MIIIKEQGHMNNSHFLAGDLSIYAIIIMHNLPEGFRFFLVNLGWSGVRGFPAFPGIRGRGFRDRGLG